VEAAEETWVKVGRIGKPFGLKGEVVVHYYAEGPDRFAPGAQVFVAGPAGRVAARVARSRQLAAKFVAAFEGREHVDAVRDWVGCFVEVRAKDLPPLPEGRFYHHELVGLQVYAADGSYVGELKEILGTGGNDVFRVCRERREFLIPAIDDAVARVDLAQGRLVLKDLDGLIEP
jgi:16S rRNA processing protein RimM